MRRIKKIILSLIILAFSLNAEEIYATFSVEADKSANLAFVSSGIVEKVNIDIGSVVKKGKILAELENSDIEAMNDVSKTALKYAKLDYNRQVQVRNVIDKSKFDLYAFKYDNAKAQLKYQQALLDKTFLKAPFDGVIYVKDVEVGDAVSGAMIRTILKIQSLHKRKLILEFDQKYHQMVKVEDTFTYKVDGDEKQYQGKISKIYPYADTANRKIKAEVEVEDFIVGLFGDGTIITQK